MLYQRRNFLKSQSVIASAFVMIIAITTIPNSLVTNAFTEGESVTTQEGQSSKTLHKAVQDSDMSEIKRLISEGADVNKLENNSTALHIAVSNNSKDIAELLLENGANIDIQDETGRTPLFLAVQNNNIGIVEILLSAKADVNIGNNRGQTPIDIAIRQNRSEILELFSRSVTISSLHTAVKLKNMEKVKEFLNQGADINEYENGDTPLIIAVIYDANDIAKLLLDEGADVNIGDDANYAPLYYAVWNSNKDMVNLLIDKGAEVNYSAEEGDSIIYEAVWEDDFDIVKILVDNGAKYEEKDEDGFNALYFAAFQESIDMVKLFLSKGIDTSSFHMAAFAGDLERVKEFIDEGMEVDAKDVIDWTALFWAVTGAQKEVVEFLMDKGADINAQMGRSGTVLHQAAKTGDISLVELFLSKGMDVNLSDQRGRTPISCAVSGGHFEAVKLLISKGADINVRNQNNTLTLFGGNTSPLYMAVSGGYKDIVEFLIGKGAEINVPISGGRTLLDIARQRDHSDIIDLLRQHGVKETIFSAVSSGNIEEIKRLISEGAEIDARDGIGGNGLTALTRAAINGRKEIVELLIDGGANMEVKTTDGSSTLNQTVAYDNNIYNSNPQRLREMIELLLDKGADIETRSYWDCTPLFLAIVRNRLDVAELLMRRGAKINSINKFWGTIAHGAMRSNLPELAHWSIEKGIDIPPLHQAAYFGDIDKVKSLISEGADVNQKDIAEFTALHCATLGQNAEIAQLLIDNGADIEARNCGNRTPLYDICHTGYLEMVKLLVENGVDVSTTGNHRNEFGPDGIADDWTPLHVAAHAGHAEIVEYLLTKGADINAKCTRVGHKDLSALHLAARYGSVDAVKVLLANGADINVKTDQGETPLSFAQAGNMSVGRRQLIQFLQDYRSLMHKELPELKEFGINLSPSDVNDKKILVCFFDIEQRPSRHCINQLTERAEQLKQQNIVTVAVQASEIEQEIFNNWIKENKITFSAGILTGNMEEKLREWGVQGMPWLILTNPEHVVIAEGFSINDLDEKIVINK